MGQSLRVLNFDKRATVAGAADLREKILAELEKTETLVLNFEGLLEIDLSFVHIVYAAAREAAAVGKQLHFTGQVHPRVGEALVAAGVVAEIPDQAARLSESLLELLPRDGQAAPPPEQADKTSVTEEAKDD